MKTQHPQWALDAKKPGTELRLIRGKYYLYGYKTVYDKAKKGPRKITGKLIGRITEQDGLIPSGKRKLEQSLKLKNISSPVCKEFGVASFVDQRFKYFVYALQSAFPDNWKSIIEIAYCRLVYHCPLKNIPFRLEQSYLPELLGVAPLAEKAVSKVLNTIGGLHSSQLQYMKSFIGKDKYLLMDATHIPSSSNLITLAKRGYNSQMNFDPQFNLLYLYSAKTHMPVYYRLLGGNIREVKAFKNCLLESGIHDAIIVADKGFYSLKNVEHLTKEKLKFILPLKRDNSLIDYSLLKSNEFKEHKMFFEYEKRMIWYQEYKVGKQSMFIYLDEDLKLNEEKDYLRRTNTHPENYSIEEYHAKRNTFGTITLLTNLQRRTAEDIYLTYKSRMAIEVMFDGMKNILEADHTYMQNEQTLHGWMFINHIVLQWYQTIYVDLKNKGLLKKYSVNDFIQALTDVKKIKINTQWYNNEFTGHTARLLDKFGVHYD